MRTITAIAGLAVFAAIATGCGTASHHTATPAPKATHSAVHATTRATTTPRPAPTHTATHSAPKHTTPATPDPYVSYMQNDAYMNVPAWDAQQAKEFAGKLCGTDPAARAADLTTDREAVAGGIFTDTEMTTNISNLTRAYCPTQRTAILAEYAAK